MNLADKLWKKMERDVGKKIFNGSKRNVGSGKINSDDDGNPRSGDVIHRHYEIEAKCYKRIAIFRWWDKLKEDSKESGKMPILVMREVGDAKDMLVCLHWEDFVKMKDSYEEMYGIED